MRALLLLAVAFGLALPLRAEDEDSDKPDGPKAEAPATEGDAQAHGASSPSGGGIGQGSPDKPQGRSKISGGGGSGSARPKTVPASGAAAGAAKPADPGEDWLHTAEGPDTPARHRRTTVPCDFTSKIDTNHETVGPHCSVMNGESCYQAAKIFVLWQQWHFRRMNRVADNANGCKNVPASEQAKILAVQAKNREMFDKMDKLAAQSWDENCDAIIQVYHDGLDWNTLSMFFKGRYMTRCNPGSSVGDDWWPRPDCGIDPATQQPIPKAACSPPLPPP